MKLGLCGKVSPCALCHHFLAPLLLNNTARDLDHFHILDSGVTHTHRLYWFDLEQVYPICVYGMVPHQEQQCQPLPRSWQAHSGLGLKHDIRISNINEPKTHVDIQRGTQYLPPSLYGFLTCLQKGHIFF